MTFLDIALDHARAGFYVFPVREDKSTLTPHGFKDATRDTEIIRQWWTTWPGANIALHPGRSEKSVLDIDYGLEDKAALFAWMQRNGIPNTYTVRSGSRPEYKAHLYFDGALPDVGSWELDGCSGQIKSLGGYVLAAGSKALHGGKHDKPGEPYEVIDGELGVFAPVPDVIRGLRKPVAEKTNNSKVPKTRWELPVHEGEDRTAFLLEQTGAMRNLGCGKDAILARMVELNEDPEIIADPVDYERLQRTAENCAKFPVPTAPPEVVIGGAKAEAESKPKDWRAHYHTREETENAPKPEFLIEGFLQRQAIVGLAGYVGHKKSLIAQNVAYSLCSGAPLFGCFQVLRRPSRVLYLCPEMALIGFANRITRIGLLPYVGETFFYATMSLKDGVIKLPDLTIEEIEGAVIVLDTAIRFIEGDENSSQHMKELATQAFGLIRSGAEAVIVLAHSNKEMVKSNELTLDNAMRGSSELTAFLSSCWATRVQDTEHPYDSTSLLKHVKPRDFEADPFEVLTDRETCRMTFVEGSEGATVMRKPTNPANADGKEEQALQVIRDNMTLSLSKIVLKLKDAGIERKKSWVSEKRVEIRHTGVSSSTL
jgi:hypothetical protein